MCGGEVHAVFYWGDLKNGDILEELESDEDEVKGEGKGKSKVHRRTGHEGAEAIVVKFYNGVFFRKFAEKIQVFIKIWQEKSVLSVKTCLHL